MIFDTCIPYIDVNCRVGSLERTTSKYLNAFKVNCRVGSLEIGTNRIYVGVKVNCRVGSLEIILPACTY